MIDNNRPTTFANSPVQWYDYVLSLAMELEWGDPENVYEVWSVWDSNPEYYTQEAIASRHPALLD
jgi:hypothetical protein